MSLKPLVVDWKELKKMDWSYSKEDQSNATTAKAISPVPTQPKPTSHGFALNRPIRRELPTMIIIMAMIGTATMPLRTALQTSM
jgi:hypothetical protein